MTTAYHTPYAFGGPLTSAGMEIPLGQLDAAIQALVVAGSGTVTSLTAIANAGQPSLTVANSAGFVAGDPIYIGTGATFETRIINTVPNATTITVTVNLSNTYAVGKPVSKSPIELVAARLAFSTLAVRLTSVPGALSPKSYGAVGDGVTDDTTALQTMASALVTGSMVDFGGATYKVTATVTVSATNVTLFNGKLLGGDNRMLQITGADVTCQDMRFERTTGPTSITGLADIGRCSVTVHAVRFRSINCDYKDASLAPLYFSSGICDGAVVRGGRFTNSSAKQNACLIYVGPGAVANNDFHISGVHATGTGCPDGLVLFNVSRARIEHNVVSDLTKLAYVNLTGWVLVSGNIYSTADRTDGTTNVLFNNAVYVNQNTATPTTPGSNEWGVSAGTVYLNLAGVNPSTRTIQSRVLGGYAILLYAVGGPDMNDNLVAENMIHDVDGMGIYFNLTANSTNNGTLSNIMRTVARAAEQTSDHRYGGISFNKGLDNHLKGDRIYSSAWYGVTVLIGSTGVMEDILVVSPTNTGVWIDDNNWKVTNCIVRNGAARGFLVYPAAGTSKSNVVFENCQASFCGTNGLDADNAEGTGLQVDVIGGYYHDNTGVGVKMNKVHDSRIIGVAAHNNASVTAEICIIDATSTRNTIADCRVTNATGGIGIRIDGTLATLSNNQIDATTVATPITNNVTGGLRIGGNSDRWIFVCTATPEAQVTAPIGSLALNITGGATTTLYVKTTGTGNTGWTAK